jgi:hypothetical protein
VQERTGADAHKALPFCDPIAVASAVGHER